MPLTKIVLNPGVNRESTAYSSEGTWFDSDLIRFRKGKPEKIGGWVRLSSNTLHGTGRSLHVWSALDAAKLMGIGTEAKFYVEEGGGYNDITPIRRTVTLSSNPFTSDASGSGIITVSDPTHGAVEGDFVTFSGATAFDGLTTANLNKEHEITQLTDPNTYKVDTNGSATSGSVAGGGTPLATYQINSGLSSTVGGNGYGAGLFGGSTTSYSLTVLNGDITDSATSIVLTSAGDLNTAATTLSANFSIGDASIPLTSPSGFPVKGTVLINSEKIRYGAVAGDTLTDLTRESDGTTEANHSSTDAVTFVGMFQVDNELIQYTGKTLNTIDAGVVRGVRGTTAVSHTNGTLVKEANDFRAWGQASSTIASSAAQIRLWAQDNWGEDLIFCVFDGTPYYWDKTLGLNARASTLSSQTGASDAPTITRSVMVSDADRHVVCFACNPLGSTDQDLLQVRWSDQENPVDWTPTATNTAGGFRISSGSEIVAAQKTRQEMLIWTDSSLHTMRFVGPPFTFSSAMVSNNVSLVGPNAVVTVGDKVFWMDTENFYVYSGRLQVIPCTVARYVFDDINLQQTAKFFAASNRMFDEVFFFYISAASSEIDRYVKFNYTDNTWDIGTLARTAWVDYGIHDKPRAMGATGGVEYVYIHESGTSDDGAPMSTFVESGDFDLGDGNNFLFINELIPDIVLTGVSATVDYTIKTRSYPGDSLITEATTAVVADTKKANIRCRGRTAAIKISSSDTETAWTLGDMRLDMRLDGRR
jgi:hypothetical protein